MEAMAQKIKEADYYLPLTPEYNHSLPLLIRGMLGHFGGSRYAFKSSGMITSSVSSLGGACVAVALLPFLSEVGCLPVSKMACFSMVGDIVEQDGSAKDEKKRQLKQLDALLDQLEWMAIACANQRDASGVP